MHICKKYILGLTLLLLFSGCTVKLTPQGKQTRQIQASYANPCKFISSEEVENGSGAMPKDDVRNAKNMMRNKVAEMGGNAYVITSRLTDIGSTFIEFEIYDCPNMR
jgi:hypothetical protein